jgi:hypothetical protein
MLKLFKCIFVIILFFPLFATATLLELSVDIDDAAYQVYVTHDGRDWAWVSPVNIQFNACEQKIDNSEKYLIDVLVDSGCENQLLAPHYRDGWRFATTEELSVIFNVLTITSFYDFEHSMYIQATEYWNTDYILGDRLNFEGNKISGEWSDNVNFETFYVRNHVAVPVPDPSVLFAFPMVLIILVRKIVKK